MIVPPEQSGAVNFPAKAPPAGDDPEHVPVVRVGEVPAEISAPLAENDPVMTTPPVSGESVNAPWGDIVIPALAAA